MYLINSFKNLGPYFTVRLRIGQKISLKITGYSLTNLFGIWEFSVENLSEHASKLKTDYLWHIEQCKSFVMIETSNKINRLETYIRE